MKKRIVVANSLLGYVVVGQCEIDGRALLVVKRPWPELPFGTDPKKTIAEDARRWAVRFVNDEFLSIEEIEVVS